MMNNLELDNRRNKFLLAIIKSIQIEMDDFMTHVANKDCYESLIYKWAISLFEKGTTTDYAINVIHRARRFVLINKTYNHYEPTTDVALDKILTMLNEHPNYNKLDSDTKCIVQKKIMEMFNHNARIEAIEQVLEKINPNVSVDREKNQVLFIKVTANRIMNAVRKWNLTEYWQNRSKK